MFQLMKVFLKEKSLKLLKLISEAMFRIVYSYQEVLTQCYSSTVLWN